MKRYDIPKIWATQITADYTAKINDNIRERLLHVFKGHALKYVDFIKDSFMTVEGYYEEYRNDPDPDVMFILKCNDAIRNLREQNKKDIEIKCKNRSLFDDVKRSLYEEIPKRNWRLDLGGSPPISALAEMHLGNGLKGISDAHYAGNLVKSAEYVLDNAYKKFKHRFTYENFKTEDEPATFSIENNSGESKIMMAFSEGRELSDLSGKKRDQFYIKIGYISNNGKKIIAFGGLNKGSPEEYAEIISIIRKNEPDVKIFISTNSFKSNEEARKFYQRVLSKADIVSYNEIELRKVYESFEYFPGKKSIVEMLSNLIPVAKKHSVIVNPHQLVVCHSEAGAIINYSGKNTKEVVNSLEIAVGGASFRYKNGRFGTEDEIKDFISKTTRSYSQFESIMGCDINDLPEGVLGTVAFDLSDVEVKGSITGAGSTFDGILLSYITPMLF